MRSSRGVARVAHWAAPRDRPGYRSEQSVAMFNMHATASHKSTNSNRVHVLILLRWILVDRIATRPKQVKQPSCDDNDVQSID